MRFHVGKVPPDETFHPEHEGWRRMREPGDLAFMTQAWGCGIVVALGLAAWLGAVAGEDGGAKVVINTRAIDAAMVLTLLAKLVGGFVLLVMVHESIHLLLHPGQGRSRYSVVGVLPGWLTFYAFYGGPIRRGRYVAMVLAPFVAISLVPAVVCTWLGPPPVWAGLVIVGNGVFSGADLTAAGLMLRRLPRGAVIRFQSWEAYWKPGAA